MVKSCFVYAMAWEAAAASGPLALTADEVWYPDVREGDTVLSGRAAAATGAVPAGRSSGAVKLIEAVAIDRRDRTKSSGYVEPDAELDRIARENRIITYRLK
jgi:hypothetical protein